MWDLYVQNPPMIFFFQITQSHFAEKLTLCSQEMEINSNKASETSEVFINHLYMKY